MATGGARSEARCRVGLPEQRLVIAGEMLGDASRQIRERFSGLATTFCATGEELRRAVDRLAPTAAFVAKDRSIEPQHWADLLASPELRWVNLGNAGYDHVPPWNRSRVVVTNSGGAGAEEMADFVIAAISMVNCGFHGHLRNQRRRVWARQVWTPLAGKTLLAVGVGHIGSRLIGKARHLGMRVIAVRDRPASAPEAHVTLPVSALAEGLAEADYISLQVPLNARTENLLGAEMLRFVKKTAWLINIGRGALVDEIALADSLRNGRIGGAVLDVFRTEPLPPTSEFWALDNVIITAHSSGETDDFYPVVTTMFCANLERFLAGEPLLRTV